MLSCKEISKLESDSMDRRLGFLEWLKIRLHLLYCKACRNFHAQLDFLRTAAKNYGSRDVADSPDAKMLPVAAKERIRQAISEKHKNEG
jgi:hypothetical protein